MSRGKKIGYVERITRDGEAKACDFLGKKCRKLDSKIEKIRLKSQAAIGKVQIQIANELAEFKKAKDEVVAQCSMDYEKLASKIEAGKSGEQYPVANEDLQAVPVEDVSESIDISQLVN